MSIHKDFTRRRIRQMLPHTHKKKLNCVPGNAVAFAVTWPKRKTWWEKMCFSETYLREESESRKFESARKVEAIIPFMDQI